MEIFGKNIKPVYLAAGAGGVGLLYFLYTRNKGSSTSASSTATDPVTGLPYSEDNQTDPTTGLTYLQEAQEYGSVSAAESAVSGGYSPYGSTGGANYSALDAGFPTANVGTVTGTQTAFSSNAQWAQAVTAGLGSLGYSSEDVAAALGLYFAAHPLGTAPDGVSYLSIVQAAVAEYGPPPVGSYAILGSPTTSTGVGNTGGGTTTTPPAVTTVTVPPTVGQSQEAGFAILAAAGLKATGTPVVKGKTLIVRSSNPKAGTKVAKGSTVKLTSTLQT